MSSNKTDVLKTEKEAANAGEIILEKDYIHSALQNKVET